MSRLVQGFIRFYLATPVALRWIYWLLPILYLISPIDPLPDMIPILGRIDDILLLVFTFWVLDRCRQYWAFKKEWRKTSREQQAYQAANPDEPRPVRAPHEVLGISPNAHPATVKRAYRQLIGMYHPDKFAYLGSEFEEAARLRTLEIIEAYQSLST